MQCAQFGCFLQKSAKEFLYLGSMENYFITLATLADLAGEHPNPLQYHCVPRELILHARFEWDTVMEHLYQLESEGLVALVQADGLRISLTAKGWDAAHITESYHSLTGASLAQGISGEQLAFAG